MMIELLKSKTGRTLIESHRGFVGDVPENSWPAIQLGHQLGADLIEVDVQLSCDDIPFLRHHYRLPDGRWCSQVAWNELKDMTFAGEPLPRLEDVLAWAREQNVYLSLDLKTAFRAAGDLTREVIRLLERTNTKKNVLLLFFDHEELAHTKLAHPELKVRALLRGRIAHYAEYIRGLGADCAVLSYDLFRPTDVDQLHALGVAAALGDVWNPDVDLSRVQEIDIFSYGNPAEARKILQREA